ncbi:creatininase family protein [Actinosynnema sp. NPDC023587]|uniref:creatininase family protein n=1 Tax=Actinosynnema sp. NPDC023587 TaxID=3154695 RepID=UPI0033D6091E
MVLPVSTSADVAGSHATVAVLPVGSFEQHGDHLPLATDTIIASLIADVVTETYGLLRLPPITISCSHEHAAYAGTISISASTLIHIVKEVQVSLERQAIDHLVIVSGHGGNYVLSNIVQEANTVSRRMALFPGNGVVEAARADAAMESSLHEDMHGGEWETSIMLHYFPKLVGSQYRDRDWPAPDRRHLLTVGMDGYTETGIIGFPSLATPAKGAAAIASLRESFADVLKVLRV